MLKFLNVLLIGLIFRRFFDSYGCLVVVLCLFGVVSVITVYTDYGMLFVVVRWGCGNLLRLFLIWIRVFMLLRTFLTLGSRVREKDTRGGTLSPHCSHNIAKS